MHIKLKYIISQSAYHRNRRINSLILSVIIKKSIFCTISDSTNWESFRRSRFIEKRRKKEKRIYTECTFKINVRIPDRGN